jgi:hypothetical protein
MATRRERECYSVVSCRDADNNTKSRLLQVEAYDENRKGFKKLSDRLGASQQSFCELSFYTR